MNLTKDDAEIVRQWFDALEDTRPDYIETKDYALAKRLYEFLEMRVPGPVDRGAVDYSGYNEHI